MLTVKDFDNQVLIQYKRNSRNMPIGVVVAIGRHALGWSLCSVWDTFSKTQAIHMALGRAMTARGLGDEGSIAYYAEKLPQSLEDLFDKVHARAELYFKESEELPTNYSF